MKIDSKARYSKEVKELVVKAIITGELWLEEAMIKYNVHDKRTVVSWIKKYLANKL